MASQAPQAAELPLLYNGLEPLNSTRHANMKLKPNLKVTGASKLHAVPITIDEFVQAQRHFPIIFASGDQPVPLALMGLNEGVNTFINDDGMPIDAKVYIPAYLRRYPFMLARLAPDSDELSLCFDPTVGALVEDEGEALFDGDQPSELTKSILSFCEAFESAGPRTQAMMEELTKSELLMEGEVTIQPEGAQQPFLYRGFRMVDEEKLRNLTGDKLRKLNQNGILPLIFAHLISLSQIRDIFYRQVEQGKGPAGAPPVAPAKANADAEA